MNEIETKEILRQAVENYGVDFNLNMVSEECGELLQAINKLRRVDHTSGDEKKVFCLPNNRSSQEYCKPYWSLCSEIADVKIMIGIMEEILSKEAIDMSYERKLTRLKERINNNQNHYNQ